MLVRKSVAPAISSTVPTRSNGIKFIGNLLFDAASMGVAMSDGYTIIALSLLQYYGYRERNLHPGQIAFERIRYVDKAVANCFTICVVAALLCP